MAMCVTANASSKPWLPVFPTLRLSSYPQAKQEAQVIRLLTMLMTYPLIIVIVILWDKDIMFFKQGCKVFTDLRPDVQERDHHAEHSEEAEGCLQGGHWKDSSLPAGYQQVALRYSRSTGAQRAREAAGITVSPGPNPCHRIALRYRTPAAGERTGEELGAGTPVAEEGEAVLGEKRRCSGGCLSPPHGARPPSAPVGDGPAEPGTGGRARQPPTGEHFRVPAPPAAAPLIGLVPVTPSHRPSHNKNHPH